MAWECPPSRGKCMTDTREKKSPLPIYGPEVEGYTNLGKWRRKTPWKCQDLCSCPIEGQTTFQRPSPLASLVHLLSARNYARMIETLRLGPKPDVGPKPDAVNARPKPDVVGRPSVHSSPCHGGRVKAAGGLPAKVSTTRRSCEVGGRDGLSFWSQRISPWRSENRGWSTREGWHDSPVVRGGWSGWTTSSHSTSSHGEVKTTGGLPAKVGTTRLSYETW
ncbi:hypothetical protein CRG98_030977 [Punica granatum]|uniref:Uncharacterized protein n=1 Tax=Punica granatum TaxID=22663 RepID=A0A2I0IX84_PUNGR|nr:hypothetical protein CRG98_030977 [Punica granatum]